MRKGWWINFILLLVLIIAGGGLWWADKKESAQQELEKAQKAISSIKADQVTQIHYQGEDGTQIELNRQQDGFHLTTPLESLADPAAVNNLLGILEKSFERQVSGDHLEATHFGLDKPEAILTVTTKENQTLTIVQGSLAPTKRHHYLRLGEQGPILLVEETHLSGLKQTLNQLRDKRLLPELEGQLPQRLTLHRKEGTLKLEKRSNEQWWMEQPVADRAADNRVQVWINALTLANGSGFQTAQPPENPDWTLTLTPNKGEEITLTIWRQGKDILATRGKNSEALLLFGYLVQDLDKKSLELIELHPLKEAQAQITQLTLEQNGQQQTAVAKEGKWPLPAWETLAETLRQEAETGDLTAPQTPASFTLVAKTSQGEFTFPFWKNNQNYLLAPPERAVRLQLTELQSKVVTDAIQVIFP
ncbi:MAG: DUF4340 domain-containing protein [Magnetococcus sp. DMHC-6]